MMNSYYTIVYYRARMDAIRFRVEGMKTENAQRVSTNASPAYREDSFFQAETELCNLAKEMKETMEKICDRSRRLGVEASSVSYPDSKDEMPF